MGKRDKESERETKRERERGLLGGARETARFSED